MKRLTILVFLCFGAIQLFAQNYAGYSSGNYTGVNGAFFNPSNIADSRYRWNVNLFGIHAGVAGSNLSVKANNIGTMFKSENIDSLLFGDSRKMSNGAVNVDFFGPSFMFNINEKTSIALTSRVRAVANMVNIDGNFVQSVKNDFDGSLPYTLSSNSAQKIAVNGWSDFGVTLGRVLLSSGQHFVKGGITLKYLAGTGNTYANIEKLQATIDQNIEGNIYFRDATGSVGIGYAGIDFDDFEANDALKFNGKGFGGDIGFVYEYRPDAGQLTERYVNKYKFKFGASLLDVGSIKYKPKQDERGHYTINVSNLEQWSPEEISGESISEIKEYLDNSPYFTNTGENVSSYKVSLPTNLQLNADYAINSTVYIELAGRINLAKKDNYYNSFYNNYISVTPRFENRHWGVYLPLSYNNLSKFNAGVSFRVGPVFLGSGSIFTALLDKSKQADVHFGINFGSAFKKPKPKKEVPPVEPAPVKDTDSDGINDNDDACIAKKGIAKYKGCPVPDTDGDSINDEEDQCPSTAGLPKYSGCPIPDTDGDGINDEEDKCPALAGIKANNGCPEIKEEIIKKMSYASKQIYFATGKTNLLSKSFHSLDEVAGILNDNPEVHLQIDGYTDNTGKAETNLVLSEKRAAVVKSYLVSKGIPENRISHTGYGQENPVADNKTAAGRAQNRRVVLTLGY